MDIFVPAVARGKGSIFIVRSDTLHVPELPVNLKIVIPGLFAAGVKVFVSGWLEEVGKLKLPPGPEYIDHVADVAPDKLAPLKVIGVGEDDWHTVFGPPALTDRLVVVIIT